MDGKIIYENIKKVCKEKKISISKLENEIEIGNGTIGKWKYADKKPYLDTIEKIANYFNVSIDYLLKRDTDAPPGTNEEKQLLNNYRAADPIGKERIEYTAETEARRTREAGNGETAKNSA